MVWNPYAAGNKVYNGGSSVATSGTVDPTGYIQRGIDGQSDTRSGLAGAALDRIRANSMSNTQAPQNVVNGPDVQGPDVANQMLAKPISPMPVTTAVGKIQADPSLSQFMNNLFTTPNVDGSSFDGLGYNPQLFDSLQDLNVNRTNTYNDIRNQMHDLLSQYGVSNRENDRKHVDNGRNILSSDAGRGMAYSSGHATNVAEEANSYARAAAELLGLRNKGLTGLTSAKDAFDLNYQTKISQIQRGLARNSAGGV